MPDNLSLKRYAHATATCIALAGAIGAAKADNLPAYMEPIAGPRRPAPARPRTRTSWR